MVKFDLTRRQFVNGSLASLGLYGITGLSNFVLADEPREFDEVKQSPKKFADLNIAFEQDAVCCKNDLAFLLA